MNSILEVLRLVVSGFKQLEIEYLIGGSFASGIWGQPRQTNDIDLALRISESQIGPLVRHFMPSFILSESSIVEAIESREPYPCFQLLHEDYVFKVDCFIADNSAFTDSEFARRRRVQILPDLEAWHSSAEDTVLRKLLWYELGNRISDRQWNDLLQVIRIQGSAFDQAYFANWAHRLELDELGPRALSEALPAS